MRTIRVESAHHTEALQRFIQAIIGTEFEARQLNVPGAKRILRLPARPMLGCKLRFQRGHAFFTAAQGAARELDVKLAWTLVEVPGVAHDGAAMSRAAADMLFGKP